MRSRHSFEPYGTQNDEVESAQPIGEKLQPRSGSYLAAGIVLCTAISRCGGGRSSPTAPQVPTVAPTSTAVPTPTPTRIPTATPTPVPSLVFISGHTLKGVGRDLVPISGATVTLQGPGVNFSVVSGESCFDAPGTVGCFSFPGYAERTPVTLTCSGRLVLPGSLGPVTLDAGHYPNFDCAMLPVPPP